MRQRRTLAELAAAKLEHDDRLDPRDALHGGAEAAAVLGALQDAGDHAGCGIVGEIIDVVGHLQHGLDPRDRLDRKSTRLNSSHVAISYAVFCLKKKKTL